MAIDRLAVGGYLPFVGSLVTREEWDGVSADQLLDDEMKAAIAARFARRFSSSFDARAMHSVWVKWYLNVFIPPILLADILLGQSVAVKLSTLRFVVTEDGRVGAVIINRVRSSYGEEPFRRFRPLVFEHFNALIQMWRVRTGLSPRVLWANVGNTFEAMLRRIEGVSGPSLRLKEAQRLLDERDWGGVPNPLFGVVRYATEYKTLIRLRRVCCLQYRLPDRRFCKACPVAEARRAHHN